MDPIIEATNLKKHFGGEKGVMDTILGNEPTSVKAVDGVSLSVNEGEIVGVAEGEVSFRDRTYQEMTGEERKEFRQQVQMIFQDPFESLNPRFTVADIVTEPLKINDMGDSYEDRRQRAITALQDAGLEPAEQYLERFPRELSGGEQQRVAIARALVVNPDFILADEPVSMLDVSIRAGVLNLMKELRDKYNLTYVIISHDLSLIRYMCDRTAIMYLGDVVEIGETETVINEPKHPYTEALLDAVPVPEPRSPRPRTRHRAVSSTPAVRSISGTSARTSTPTSAKQTPDSRWPVTSMRKTRRVDAE
jgi:peptide/nickel transport system ATP-binding protein